VAHPTLHSGDACPGCESGKLYQQSEPAKLVRITGMAPLSASVYSCDRLRCNLCGEVVTAPAPEGVGPEKYDATATSMVGLLKYGAGLPFNRIEKLQSSMGIPLPAATQWDLVQAAAKTLTPAHEELINQAAQATVLYNDDTTMKVLQLTRKQRAAALADDADGERTGISPPASSQRTPGTGSPCSSPGCVTPARISPRCSPAATPIYPRRSKCATGSRGNVRASSTRSCRSASLMPEDAMWN